MREEEQQRIIEQERRKREQYRNWMAEQKRRRAYIEGQGKREWSRRIEWNEIHEEEKWL